MECRAVLATSKMYVRLSVCPSNAWIVTKRKKLVPTFLHIFVFSSIVVYAHYRPVYRTFCHLQL